MAGTLIFDGNCGFCRASAEWCRRRLGPLHSVRASQEYDDAELAALGLTRAQVDAAAWWVDDGRAALAGRPVSPLMGADAIAACLIAIGGAEAMVGQALRLPLVRPLAGAVYGWVAEHRPLVGAWFRQVGRAARGARRLTRR